LGGKLLALGLYGVEQVGLDLDYLVANEIQLHTSLAVSSVCFSGVEALADVRGGPSRFRELSKFNENVTLTVQRKCHHGC